MEKLIELLNEYSKKNQEYSWEIEWKDIIAYSHFWEWYETIRVSESIIISKWYEFVKWLVATDKIETRRLETVEIIPKFWWTIWKKAIWEKRILMLLSINDNPIDYLISILK